MGLAVGGSIYQIGGGVSHRERGADDRAERLVPAPCCIGDVEGRHCNGMLHAGRPVGELRGRHGTRTAFKRRVADDSVSHTCDRSNRQLGSATGAGRT